MKARKDLKILLLQIRDEPLIRQEELDSFLRYGGLREDQVDVLNVYDTPEFSHRSADTYDALFVGGSSDASVLEPQKYPFVHPSQNLIIECLDKNKPVFASCFGFQLAVLALGGEVITDSENYEMGCLPISLTDEAKNDLMYHDTPDGFVAISVHKEKALEAPKGCTTLAYTKECCHSFRVEGKDFWAFQFHPEVDRQILIDRLTFYKQRYTDGDDHLDEVLKNAVETPESNILVRKFVDRVLLSE